MSCCPCTSRTLGAGTDPASLPHQTRLRATVTAGSIAHIGCVLQLNICLVWILCKAFVSSTVAAASWQLTQTKKVVGHRESWVLSPGRSDTLLPLHGLRIHACLVLALVLLRLL
jgi:hypothetical protein